MATLPSQPAYQISGIVMPLTPRRNFPTRLYLTGAVDNADDEGVYSYIITRRTSNNADLALTDADGFPIEPSGFYAMAIAGSGTYNLFTSGYESEIHAEIPVESSPYFANTGVIELYSGTLNPASGMTPASGTYQNSDAGRIYMYEDWYWPIQTYCWYYIGAKDKSGNITDFINMHAHPGNPFYGGVSVTVITIPGPDNTAPTGMVFYY